MDTFSLVTNVISIVAAAISFWTWLIVIRQGRRAARMIDVYLLADGQSARRVAAMPARSVSRGEVVGLLGMLPNKSGQRLHLIWTKGEIQSVQDQVGEVINDRRDSIVVRVSAECYESIQFEF